VIRSMTGFGEAELGTSVGLLRVEMKSVNHRFFNASIRTPYGFDRFEPLIQGWLKESVSRGHVTLTLTLDTSAVPDSEPVPEVDLERARHYREILTAMARDLDLPGEVDLTMMAGFRDLIRAPEGGRRVPEVEVEQIEAVVRAAAESLVATRMREGRAMARDLRERLDAMSEHLSVVADAAPVRLVRERDRLREAIQELAGDAGVDEERLAREVAHLAERWDINEEIVRFRTHLTVFGETLDRSDPEPVGKRLGFIVQEMHREANTIGSKANDPEISLRSVSLKEEIERLREQLENVE
jgi:uncharacterized protein (TIGR00255 family)